jgi:hypothetical protein
MEDFKKLLECPVCYDILTPPVQTCDNGHVICQGCKYGLQSCPTCRGNFIVFKNTLLDQLLDSLPVECAFATNGCEKVMNIGEKVAHENVCNYRLIKCPSNDCEEVEVIYCKLKEHLSKCYSYDSLAFNEKVSVCMDLKNPSAKQLFGMYKERNCNQYFCLRCSIDLPEQTFTFCVQHIGRREEASAYIYQVSFDQGLGVEFKFGGYCLPYMDKYEEILSQPKVLTLSLDKLFLGGVPSNLYVDFAIGLSTGLQFKDPKPVKPSARFGRFVYSGARY